MDFDIKMPGEDEKLRQAYRTRVPGLDVRIVTKAGEQDFPVLDISASGFAFADSPRNWSNGQDFQFQLLLAKGSITVAHRQPPSLLRRLWLALT